MKRYEFQELHGVIRNPVEGVSQAAPRKLGGIDFDRMGGYRVTWGRSSTVVAGGLGMQPLAHDENGLAWFATNVLLADGEKHAVSNVTGGFPTYLVPNTGVATHLLGKETIADDYQLAAFARARDGDVSQISDSSFSFEVRRDGDSGTGLPAGTYDVSAFVFAPTPTGLLAVAASKRTVTLSLDDMLTTTSNTVFPSGYVMRAYLRNREDAAALGESSTSMGRQAYSNGSEAMSVVFDGYLASDVLATDALLNFGVQNGGVELHNRRVWGIAASTPMVGPFSYDYFPTKTFKIESALGHPAITQLKIETGPYFSTTEELSLDGATEFTAQFYFGHNTVVRVVNGGPPGEPSSKYQDNVEWQDVRGTYWFLRGKSGTSDATPETVAFGIEGRLEYQGNIATTRGWDWIVKTGTTEDRIPIMAAQDGPVTTSSEFWSALRSRRLELRVNTNDRIEIRSYNFQGGLEGTWTRQLSGGSALPFVGDVTWLRVGELTAHTDATVLEVEQVLRRVSLYMDSEPSGSSEVMRVQASDWRPNSSLTSTETGEVWSVDNVVELVGGAPPLVAHLKPENTVIYSDFGFVNFASSYEQYVQVPLTNSERITGLASTPAGLLALGNNEAFLVRSDPALQDFSVQRFMGTIGCDEGTRPAKLGGHVAVIWKGRLFGISLGMGDVDFGSGLTDLGKPVFDPEDPFVQVVGEPRSRQFVVRTVGGRVLRLNLDEQKWTTDPYDGAVYSGGDSDLVGLPVRLLLPTAGEEGSYYLLGDELRMVEYANLVDPGSPELVWEHLDVPEDRHAKKLWRRVRVYLSDSYGGRPTLDYEIGGRSGSVSGTREGTGEWVFTLPGGLVSNKITSMTLNLVDAAWGDTMEPPLVIEYQPRYTRR